MTNDTMPTQLSLFDVEQWKPIPDYEDHYMVSNKGRVMRIKGGKGATVGFILTPTYDSHGYPTFRLSKKSVYGRYFGHYLVMLAFVGARPQQMDINHINGVKTDNRLENLEYCTRSENIRHSYEVNKRKIMRGEDSGRHKVTEAQVREIRQLHQTKNMTIRQIADLLEVTHSIVEKVVHYRRWKHIE